MYARARIVKPSQRTHYEKVKWLDFLRKLRRCFLLRRSNDQCQRFLLKAVRSSFKDVNVVSDSAEASGTLIFPMKSIQAPRSKSPVSEQVIQFQHQPERDSQFPEGTLLTSHKYKRSLAILIRWWSRNPFDIFADFFISSVVVVQ